MSFVNPFGKQIHKKVNVPYFKFEMADAGRALKES